MPLVSREQLKVYARDRKAVVDTEFVELAAASAEETMADLTGRLWVVAPASTFTEQKCTPRRDSKVLRIRDCVEVQSVKFISVSGTVLATVSASQYVAEPLDGLSESGASVPFEQLRRIDVDAWPWENDRPTVAVTARWGWPAIPTRVTQAAMMMAQEILVLRDVSGGVNAALGNPFVQDTINRYRRSWGVG